MAIYATYIVLEVLRAQEVGVFFPKFVTAQAALRRLLSRKARKADDLIGIRGLCVFLSWSMAALTSLPLNAVLVMQCFPVRSFIERLANVFVAGLTCICTDVL